MNRYISAIMTLVTTSGNKSVKLLTYTHAGDQLNDKNQLSTRINKAKPTYSLPSRLILHHTLNRYIHIQNLKMSGKTLKLKLDV